MPFSEFRFLNGSNRHADSTIDVDGTPIAIPNVPPKTEQVLPLPPPPPPPGNQIVHAQVQSAGQMFQLMAPLPAPPGDHWQTAATVISEGTSPDVLCVLVARSGAGVQACEELR